jgi:hypothetical protein
MPILIRSRIARRVGRLAACCVAVALVWGCGPVYIPVPPPVPSAPAFTAELVTDPSGQQTQRWRAMGEPEPAASNGTFFLQDEAVRTGVFVTAADDGSYMAPPMEGTEGDRVRVYYSTTRGQFSETICVILSERRPAAASCP